MASPTKFKPFPQATTTKALGVAEDASSELWQRLPTAAGSLNVIRSNVPWDVMQNILQSNDPDTAILLLRGYPVRVSS